MPFINRQTKAHAFLLLATLFWGATFTLIKDAIQVIDPNTFVLVRFGLAALILFIVFFPFLKQTTKPLLKASLVLGLLNGAGYLLQTLSLQDLTAARCAFMTGSSVMFVPFLAWLFDLDTLRWQDLTAALISLLGLFILTGAHLKGWSRGDLWVLISALAFAGAIVYLQRLLLRTELNYRLICFYQILFTLIIPLLLWHRHANYPALLHFNVAAAVIFCAICATVLPFFWQTRYQCDTTASKAVVIYALEPVFATLFGLILANESLSRNLVLGGSVMLLGMMFTELLKGIKVLLRITHD
jgi:drug/metabolite transporter (DMT)-like permease